MNIVQTTYNHTHYQIHKIVYDKRNQNKFDNIKTMQSMTRETKIETTASERKKNYYGVASLPPDPLIGFKRPLMKSYPYPPPCCDPDPP
jgi:hypothetical protein